MPENKEEAPVTTDRLFCNDYAAKILWECKEEEVANIDFFEEL